MYTILKNEVDVEKLVYAGFLFCLFNLFLCLL